MWTCLTTTVTWQSWQCLLCVIWEADLCSVRNKILQERPAQMLSDIPAQAWTWTLDWATGRGKLQHIKHNWNNIYLATSTTATTLPQQSQHQQSSINNAVVVTAARASALKKTLKVLVCQLQIVNMSVEISWFLCLSESTNCVQLPTCPIQSVSDRYLC